MQRLEKLTWRLGRRLDSQGRNARRLRARDRRSTRPHDFRAGGDLRQAFRRASSPRLAAGGERVWIAARHRDGTDDFGLLVIGALVTNVQLRRGLREREQLDWDIAVQCPAYSVRHPRIIGIGLLCQGCCANDHADVIVRIRLRTQPQDRAIRRKRRKGLRKTPWPVRAERG